MSILDELRDESRQKKQQDSASKNQDELLEESYQASILPKMQESFSYFKELIEHLKFTETVVEVENYNIRSKPTGLLTQKNYRINTDGFGGFADYDRLMEINLSFSCEGEGSVCYEIEGKNRIEQEVALLHSKNLQFRWENQHRAKNKRLAMFTISKKIPVRFRIEVDYKNSKIILLIHNHEDLKVYQKSFTANEMTQEVFDEISRYMLRKDSDCLHLEISNINKQVIRDQLLTG